MRFILLFVVALNFPLVLFSSYIFGYPVVYSLMFSPFLVMGAYDYLQERKTKNQWRVVTKKQREDATDRLVEMFGEVKTKRWNMKNRILRWLHF